MVIYEINLSVDRDVAEEFTKWLETEHLGEMSENEGFFESKVFYRKPQEEGLDDKKALLTVHYSVHSRKDLERYFEDHAEVLRSKATDLFGDKFTADRRILYKD